jgi:hypothetical protein
VIEAPRGGAPEQYRERLDHKLFHSGGRSCLLGKDPALSVFSPMNTAAVPRFSTDVEESGEDLKIPGNAALFALPDRS